MIHRPGLLPDGDHWAGQALEQDREALGEKVLRASKRAPASPHPREIREV